MTQNYQNSVDLDALFADYQTEMEAKLQKIRCNIEHSGTKGRGTEKAWLGMLEDYLPKRYRCKHAAVVDHIGNRSDAIDILVFDRQYSPFILNDSESEIQLIPAESVYAALEVKQNLTKGHIEYAGEKVASVRRLERTSTSVRTITGMEQRKPFPILGGVLSSVSDWNPPFGRPFERTMRGLEPSHQLDLGCALREGAFEVSQDEDGSHISSSDGSTGLIRFLLILLRRLQGLGTAPPIDFHQYEQILE